MKLGVTKNQVNGERASMRFSIFVTLTRKVMRVVNVFALASVVCYAYSQNLQNLQRQWSDAPNFPSSIISSWEEPVSRTFRFIPDQYSNTPLRRIPGREGLGYWANIAEHGKKSETVVLHFNNVSSAVDPNFFDNATMLSILNRTFSDRSFLDQMDYVTITGASSPDGDTENNERLAAERAVAIKNYILRRHPDISRDRILTFSAGEDWDGLRRLIEADYTTPNRAEALRILAMPLGGEAKRQRLQQLGNGKTYRYLTDNMFPYLRGGAACLIYFKNGKTGAYKNETAYMPGYDDIYAYDDDDTYSYDDDLYTYDDDIYTYDDDDDRYTSAPIRKTRRSVESPVSERQSYGTGEQRSFATTEQRPTEQRPYTTREQRPYASTEQRPYTTTEQASRPSNAGSRNVPVQQAEYWDVPLSATTRAPKQTAQAPQYDSRQTSQAPQYGSRQTAQAPQYGSRQTSQAPQYGSRQTAQVSQYGPKQTAQVTQYVPTQIKQSPQYAPKQTTQRQVRSFYADERQYERTALAIKTNLLFDVVSAINFELEIPIEESWSLAGEYIFPWWLNEEKQNCTQLVSCNVELRHWFGYRENRSRLTGWFGGIFIGGGYFDFERNKKGYQGEFYISTGLGAGYAHQISRDGKWRMEYSTGLGYLTANYREYNARFGFDGKWHLIRQKSGNYSFFGPVRAKISLVYTINRK